MSIRLMNGVWQVPDLRPAERLVLLCFATFADDDGGRCFPSIETVADRCEMRPRSVSYIVARLKRRGLLIDEEAARWHRAPKRRIVLPIPDEAEGMLANSTPKTETGMRAGCIPVSTAKQVGLHPETSGMLADDIRDAGAIHQGCNETASNSLVDPLCDSLGDPSVCARPENGNGTKADEGEPEDVERSHERYLRLCQDARAVVAAKGWPEPRRVGVR